MGREELTLKEAEQIVDTMYQNKFIYNGTIEGNNIHLQNMDNIEFTDLENASIYLLREEIRLKEELQRKDNIIKDIKEYVNYLVIFNQTINGKFSETQWGQDILGLIKELENDN